jgi:hypothetical protein
MDIVKLNFHLELYVTLDCYLSSRLALKCKSSANQASLIVVAYRRAFPRLKLMRHTSWPYMRLLCSTQLPWTVIFNSQTHIYRFVLQRIFCRTTSMLK